MIYGADNFYFVLGSVGSSDYSQTSEPVEIDTPRPSEDMAQETEDPSIRAVYDGDISDGILAKFSEYYNTHAGPFDKYVIYRPSQYQYVMVYGQTSDFISWTSAQEVLYNAPTYGTSATFSLGRSGSFSIGSSALVGNTGFVYSSSSDFFPSRYVDSGRINTLIGTMLLVSLLGFVLYKWLSHLFSRR